MKNKAFSKISFLIILVVIIGGYLGWQYLGVPKEGVKDEIADWKTYRNEEYGFEIKYPPNYENYSDPDDIFFVDIDGGILLILSIVPPGDNKETVQEFVNKLNRAWEETNLKTTIVDTQTTSVDGEMAIEQQSVTGNLFVTITYFKVGDFMCEFSRSAGHNELNIYRQILSTFKFLK